MNFTELVTEVLERLNLSSTDATARIGRVVNERYRWLASSIGMETTVRGTATANTVVGNRSLTFGPKPIGVEKLFAVYDATTTPFTVLDELSFDEMRNRQVGTDPPQRYAIQLMAATSVTILLDCTPATIYTLTADVETTLATLSGLNVPAFPESYHDALIYGAMATELEKMEKYDLAKAQEKRFEERASQLRLFIAKSAYLDFYQGKTARSGRRAWWA